MDAKIFSNYNKDGRIYPDTCKVVPAQDGWFEVWDITGWNGFEVCDDELVARFKNEGSALAWAELNYSKWSDPLAVLDAAIALINKEKGAFHALKSAVDWRDRES